MNKILRTIGLKIFPNLYVIANSSIKNTSITKPKTINWHKEFKNSGYIRKINSISKNISYDNSESFHISESCFYRGEQRAYITCNHKDFLLISDYYTSNDMIFFNKLTLIQCDFNRPKNYNIICVKEAPFNKSPLRELESEIALELSKLDDIKII